MHDHRKWSPSIVRWSTTTANQHSLLHTFSYDYFHEKLSWITLRIPNVSHTDGVPESQEIITIILCGFFPHAISDRGDPRISGCKELNCERINDLTIHTICNGPWNNALKSFFLLYSDPWSHTTYSDWETTNTLLALISNAEKELERAVTARRFHLKIY